MENFLSLARDNGFTLPDYGNSNLSVLKDIVDGRGSRHGDRGKTIFLVADGMGYNLIEGLLAGRRPGQLLSGSRVERIRTVCPSGTASVISSFETGLTTAEHGMVGWDVYSRDHGMIITTFRDSPPIAENFRLAEEGIVGIRPDPILFKLAAERGRALFLHQKPTGMNIKYGDRGYYEGMREMLKKLGGAVRDGDHDFIYVHYPRIDYLEHRRGLTSAEVGRETSSLLSGLSGLMPSLRKNDYNLVLTADHGQVVNRRRFVVDRGSGIMRYLWGPPWGGKRLLYFNAIHGKEEALRRQFEREYGKSFLLVESESAIRSGIFGKRRVDDALRYRFGTHIAIATGNDSMVYEYPYDPPRAPRNYKGSHSGLQAGEMEVPLIVY